MPTVTQHKKKNPVNNPVTLQEWRAHIDALQGEALAHKAALANSARFVRGLQDEGYDAEQVHAILIFLAQRVRAAGLPAPEGLYDFTRLSTEEPAAVEGGPVGRAH